MAEDAVPKVGNFEVMHRMVETDDRALRFAPLSNVIEARKVKAGTKVTIGVGEDIVGTEERGLP